MYSLFNYFILWVKYYSITHLLLINVQNTSMFARTIKECFNFCFCNILSPEWANGMLTAQFSLKYWELLGQTCIHNDGDLDSIPGSERSPGEGNGNPLQYSCPPTPQKRGSKKYFGEANGNPLQCSCLENPRDGGPSWASIYGVAQSWTQLKQLSSSRSNMDILDKFGADKLGPNIKTLHRIA